MKIKKMMNFS